MASKEKLEKNWGTSINERAIYYKILHFMEIWKIPCVVPKFPVFSLSGKSDNQIPCFPCAVATLLHFWPPISPTKKDTVHFKHGGFYGRETWKPLAEKWCLNKYVTFWYESDQVYPTLANFQTFWLFKTRAIFNHGTSRSQFYLFSVVLRH